ncbi:MAG TPA: hypothetical protein VKB46_18765 [Pyrinomonadaceae bacterium]|nr:hypothetical protein [Pyrinomonadaceae bacterium]
MRTFLLLTILLSCLAGTQRITSDGQNIPASQKTLLAPEGWATYTKPTAEELQCANYSQREWRVSLAGDRLETRLDTLRDHQDPLPAQIHSRDVAVGTKGYRHVISVDDGWLVGMDIGEFGGGLWWFSADGLRSRKLSNENIVGFAATAKGTLIFVGLAHLALDEGKVLRISDGTNAERQLEPLVNLGSAPVAFAVEAPDSVIVLTTTGLVRVRTSGPIEHLLKTRYGQLYPTSLTLSSSGVIYVGMRQFITRLTPAGNTYSEEWFVPADCPKFTIREIDCVCARR